MLLKNLRYIFCIITIALTVESCKTEDNSDSSTFYVGEISNSSELKGINIESLDIYSNSYISIVDSFLVFLTLEEDHGAFIHIYDRKTLKLIKRHGGKGKGPNEFITPRLANIRENVENSSISAYDWTRRRLHKIDIREVVYNENYTHEVSKLDNSLKDVGMIIHSDKEKIILVPGGDAADKERFRIYNKAQNRSISIPHIPKLDVEIHPNNLYSIYATSSFTNIEEKSCFVAMPNLMAELDFFDYDGNFLKSVVIERVDELKYGKNSKFITQVPNMKMYWTCIQKVDNELFVAITDKKFPGLTNLTVTKIYVFDLDGVPLRQFTLDREIHKFVYDPKFGHLIGFCPLEEDKPYILYKIPPK